MERLVELCEEILKAYDPVRGTLDSHAEAFLAPRKKVSSEDKVFARQVLYGCVRFKVLLRVLLTSFYYNNGATASRNDYTKFLVLSYLSLFRVKEMGFPAFAQIVKSQAPEKMHVFLSFVFDVATLEKWVKDEWIKHYDLHYVENEILGTIKEFAEVVQGLCEELSEAAFGKAKLQVEAAEKAGVPEVMRKPPTIPRPFNITPPRPTKVPEPFPIKQEVKAKPVPEKLNQRTLASIEEERKLSKERIVQETKAKYSDTKEFQFSEIKDTLTKAIEEEHKKLSQIMNKQFYAKPVPDFESMPANVKLNAAAILREDALFKKKQEKEAKLLKAYEEDLRDSTDFYRWQEEQRKKDEEEKLKLVAERRLSSIISQQQSKLAFKRQLEENKKQALQLKKEIEEKIEEKQLMKENIIVEKRRVVEKVQSTRNVPAKEQRKIAMRKREKVVQVRKEQKKLEEEKFEEQKVEQERRNDIIRQIRALERVPKKNVKKFDPTESSGHGFLNEMSLLELKERLAIKESKKKKEEEEMRRRIRERKQDTEEKLQKRMQVICNARKVAAASNKVARMEKKSRDVERDRLEQELRDKAKLKLIDRLAAKRTRKIEEITSLQQEEAGLKKKNQFLGAQKEVVEAKVHEEFLKGLERTAKDKQARSLQEAYKTEQINLQKEAIRVENKLKKERELQEDQEVAEMQLQMSKKQSREDLFALSKEKRQRVLEERARNREAMAKLHAWNPHKHTKPSIKNLLPC